VGISYSEARVAPGGTGSESRGKGELSCSRTLRGRMSASKARPFSWGNPVTEGVKEPSPKGRKGGRNSHLHLTGG